MTPTKLRTVKSGGLASSRTASMQCVGASMSLCVYTGGLTPGGGPELCMQSSIHACLAGHCWASHSSAAARGGIDWRQMLLHAILIITMF